MKIDKKLLDSLSAQAKESDRLRVAHDLRTTPEDNSQRILNAMEQGTVLPIHRHRGSTETVVILRGKLRQNFYDEAGQLVESLAIEPGTECVGFSVCLVRANRLLPGCLNLLISILNRLVPEVQVLSTD